MNENKPIHEKLQDISIKLIDLEAELENLGQYLVLVNNDEKAMRKVNFLGLASTVQDIQYRHEAAACAIEGVRDDVRKMEEVLA